MEKPFWRWLFGPQAAIDLGTSTLIFVQNRGVVLNQPTVVCFKKPNIRSNSRDGRVEVVGEHAKALLGRSPVHLEVVCPVQHGVIANYHAAEQLIQQFVKHSKARSQLGRRVEFTVCVPSNASAIELHSIRDAMFAAGATKVNLIEAVLAAALGAGLPVAQPIGSMVVDIGGGTTQAALVALGNIVHRTAARVGSDQFDAAIISFVRSTYGVTLGEHTAELVKKTIGSATRQIPCASMKVVGRSVENGLPRTVELTNHEIADAIASPLQEMLTTVRAALEHAPLELVADVANRGITLTGSGALLGNMSQYFAAEIGVSAHLADEPESCAVRGAGKAMMSYAACPFREEARPLPVLHQPSDLLELHI
ncbi:rod shape-determining protein [Burkholderia ubonensis]|uniref:rod shape-determining protein n=1 Tax=Burkholderia ubonensis TaxID=101571 RepID=UPI0009B3E490|nr:rod shape-determining protein [Burkholderia ubonensis]